MDYTVDFLLNYTTFAVKNFNVARDGDQEIFDSASAFEEECEEPKPASAGTYWEARVDQRELGFMPILKKEIGKLSRQSLSRRSQFNSSQGSAAANVVAANASWFGKAPKRSRPMNSWERTMTLTPNTAARLGGAKHLFDTGFRKAKQEEFERTQEYMQSYVQKKQ